MGQQFMAVTDGLELKLGGCNNEVATLQSDHYTEVPLYSVHTYTYSSEKRSYTIFIAGLPYSLVPRCLRGEERAPGTHCLRMRLINSRLCYV